jgi:hypothetical protein
VSGAPYGFGSAAHGEEDVVSSGRYANRIISVLRTAHSKLIFGS